MKTLSCFQYTIVLFAMFLFSCKNENTADTPEPEIHNSCKISGMTYESSETDQAGNIITRAKETLKNGYDENLNLIFSDHLTENWQNEILVRKRLYQSSNQFDPQNFLKNSIVKIEGNTLYNNQMPTSYAGSAGTYKYENQRLVLATIKTLVGKNNDTIATSTEKFEYSPQGQLIKKIVSSSNNETTSTFLNGVLVAHDETNPSSKREITYNAMGFQTVVKTTLTNNLLENRNTYDNLGNLIQTDYYNTGTLMARTLYTYGPVNLQDKAQPRFLGHPVIASVLGSNASLLQKSESFSRTGFGPEMIKTSETNYTYNFNASGYITSLKMTGKSFDLTDSRYKTSETTQTLTYTNCK